MSKVFSISEAKSIAEFSDVAQKGKEFAAFHDENSFFQAGQQFLLTF